MAAAFGRAKIMPEKKQSPQIRFKEFSDTWEQRKLGEVCKSFTDGDWIESKDQSESGVRLLQTGNVGITNFVEKDNKKWITEETFNRLRCSEVCPGDILISRLPEPAGRACIVPDIGYKMITAVDCTIVKNDENFSNEFLVQFLSTAKYFNTVNDFLAGGTRQRISRNNLSKFDILIPKINEQKKIGTFFSKLDNLITLHQCKYEKLLTMKKSCLEKMFPKNKNKNPEIRFKGFTDTWEQRKLGEISDVTKLAGFEFTNHVIYSDTGNVIALRGLNVKNGSLVLDDVKYIDNSNFNKLNRSKLFKNDILFTYVGTVGELAVISENNRFYLAPNVARIRIKSNDNPNYISQYMRSESFYNSVIFPLIATSSQPALSMENIRKFEVKIPQNAEEQNYLSCLFAKFDHLITLHQRKLQMLKNIKKSCLEKMFV